MKFQVAEKLFKDDKIHELETSPDGIRFLKLRSLNRKDILDSFAAFEKIDMSGVARKDFFKFFFENPKITDTKIETFIRQQYKNERAIRKKNESELVNELYKVEAFDWGGLYQNNLEKTIVDNYIKKLRSYSTLVKAIEGDISKSVHAYVISSWYNHWSSIIIEDIFKDHPKTLPAIGLVKKIDFFLGNIPFDLKVTYLPEGFLDQKRRESNLRPELTALKSIAREKKLSFDRTMSGKALAVDLHKKIRDLPKKHQPTAYNDILTFRQKIINDISANSEELAIWLYENQGTRRFDASNRVFLVLIDEHEYYNSWQLKRAIPLITDSIKSALDAFQAKKLKPIKFQWEGQTHIVNSKVIIVRKTN